MQDDFFENDLRGDLLQQGCDTRPDLFGELFRGRNDAAHPRHIDVEILVVDISDDPLGDDLFELAKVHDHPGLLVEWASHADFQAVVVAMPRWV